MNGTDRASGQHPRQGWSAVLGVVTVLCLLLTGCAGPEPAQPGAGSPTTVAATGSTSVATNPTVSAESTADSSKTSSTSATHSFPEPSAPTNSGDATTMSGTVSSIEGVTWTLVAAMDNAGETAPIPAGLTPTLEITDDRLAVDTGCNSGGGSVAVSPSGLEVGPIATTRMACDEARMKLEQTVLGVLSTRSSYRIDDSTLTITNSAGTLVYRNDDDAQPSASEPGPTTARPGPTRVTALSPELSVTWPPTRGSMLPSIPEDPRGSTN